MAVFTAGDRPVSEFSYELGDDVPWSEVEASLVVALQELPAELDGESLTGSWDTFELPPAGLYPIRAEFERAGRREGQLVDWLVVVEQDDAWHNAATARFEWDGAPTSDGTLYRLLQTAREQVEAYGQHLPAGARVPELWRQAQLSQARNMYNATLTSGDSSYDLGGGVVITPRPLDWAVKQLIRPRTATKVLG